jgi:hypothetical protein
MMVEVSLPIILQLVQTIALVVGIIYYITIMRNNQRANKLYTLQQRMQNMDRPYYQAWTNVLNMKYETPEEWMEKYSAANNPEVYADWSYVGTLIHNIGYLLKNGLVEPDTIFELYSPGSILRVWKRYEVMIEYSRSLTGSNLWDNFEYLKDEAGKRFPELHLPDYY